MQAAKNPNGGKSVQRPVDHRPVEYRQHALVRDEHLIGHGVVTAGAAQAKGVPGVEDLQLLGGQRDHGRAILEHAAGEQHVGVGDAAAERPSARHHDAAGHAPGLALRRPYAGGHTASVAEQLVAADRRQICDQQAAGDRDRHAPAGRRVAAGHLLGAAQSGARGQLQRVDLYRRTCSQQARISQRANQFSWQPAAGVDLICHATCQLGNFPGPRHHGRGGDFGVLHTFLTLHDGMSGSVTLPLSV